MQRWTLFATLASALMLGACTGDAGKATPTPQPTKTMSPAGRQSVERQAEEAMRLREVNQQETENTMSPYRYVVSTERYSTFGKLLKRSTHSKTVHAMGVTLLAPTNEAFEDFEDWKLLLGKGNQAMLDEFVATASRHTLHACERRHTLVASQFLATMTRRSGSSELHAS